MEPAPRAGRRDAEAIVRELRALLDQAGVQRSLVLTGHSAGGLYVREYAREFPAEVAGVVLNFPAGDNRMRLTNATSRASFGGKSCEFVPDGNA